MNTTSPCFYRGLFLCPGNWLRVPHKQKRTPIMSFSPLGILPHMRITTYVASDARIFRRETVHSLALPADRYRLLVCRPEPYLPWLWNLGSYGLWRHTEMSSVVSTAGLCEKHEKRKSMRSRRAHIDVDLIRKRSSHRDRWE